VFFDRLAVGQESKSLAKDSELLMSGRWQGTWLSLSSKSSGYVYSADLQVKVQVDGAVEGKINWTVKKAPLGSSLAPKVGRSAVEFVKGKFDPASRTLSLAGYKKDDPQGLIGLDRYRLILADNDIVLGGITSSQDTWQGLLSLSLKK